MKMQTCDFICALLSGIHRSQHIGMRQEDHLCMSIRTFRNFSREAKMLLLPTATVASGEEQEGERPRNHLYSPEFTPTRPCDHASILLIIVIVTLDLQRR